MSLHEIIIKSETYLNGTVKSLVSTYPNGIKHGISQYWYGDGTLADEFTYVNGLRHGISRRWFPNGVLLNEFNYLFGKAHGLCQRWYISGIQRDKVYFVNGEPHGICYTWGISGTLDDTRYYSYGTDVTSNILQMVNDVNNLTDYEKTLIALEFGISL